MDQQLMPLSCLGLRRPPSVNFEPAPRSLQRRRSCAELTGVCTTEASAAATNSRSMVCLNHSQPPPLECPSNVPAHPVHHNHHHHQHQYIYQLRNKNHLLTPGSQRYGSDENSLHGPEDLLQVMEKRRHRINECRLMARSTVATSASAKSCNQMDGLTSSTML